MEGEKIEYVKELIYLRQLISFENQTDQEIKSKGLYSIYHQVWTNIEKYACNWKKYWKY